MKDIEKAYHKVFRDLMLHGPNMFKGVYDSKNGSEVFMYGVQTVMEYIASRDCDDTCDKFTDMFNANIVKSQEDVR